MAAVRTLTIIPLHAVAHSAHVRRPAVTRDRSAASPTATRSGHALDSSPHGLPFPMVARTFSRGDSRTDSSSIRLPRHARQRQTAHRAVWTEDDLTAPHQGSSLRLWSLLDPIPAIGPWSQALFDAVVPRLDLGALEGRAAQPGISSGEVRTVPFCTVVRRPKSRRFYCSISSGLTDSEVGTRREARAKVGLACPGLAGVGIDVGYRGPVVVRGAIRCRAIVRRYVGSIRAVVALHRRIGC